MEHCYIRSTDDFIKPSQITEKDLSIEIITILSDVLLITTWGIPLHEVGENILVFDSDTCKCLGVGKVIGTRDMSTGITLGKVEEDEYEYYVVK
jgi:hypothetical protein